MSAITSAIGYPLGWVMWAIHFVVKNYGVALLLFTVFSRLIMLPVTLNQQKSTAKMTLLQPQIQELRKKYGNNAQKLNEETMALYNKIGYNPMSGCLPMVIQFGILFGIIDVIYKPLRHILRLDSAVVNAATEIVKSMGEVTTRAASSVELLIVREVSANPSAFYHDIGREAVAKIQDFAPQLNFLGIDLMTTPSTGMLADIFRGAFNPVILIPILSGLTSLVLSLSTMRSTSAAAAQAGGGSMKAMMLMMPVFSTMFTFSVPAGVGLYWTYSNVVGIAQTMIINKIYNPKEMAEKAQKEIEEQKERERQERIEAKKRAKEQGVEEDEKALSKKELNRRKLAEARKRDAEKYGEDYAEVTEDDLG